MDVVEVVDDEGGEDVDEGEVVEEVVVVVAILI